MAQKPDGKSSSTERVAFTKPAAERIAKVVRKVEAGKRESNALAFGNRVHGASGAAIKICTFTGSWSKGTSHVTTFYNVTTTPNTVTATNVFVDVNSCNTNSTSATAACAIAKYAGAWYLIAAECC